MWSVSIHLCRLNQRHNILLCLFFLSSTLLSLSSSGAVTAASDLEVRSSNDIDQELILTRKEKLAFDKFKAAVYSNITHPFLKQDIYLLRWIRAKDLNLNVAVQDMFELLEFLGQNHVSDKILEEDWSDMIEDHPFHFEALDRQGRPVVYGAAGDGWNIRRTIVQGKRARFMRYTYYIVWKLMKRFMDINQQHPNVTQCIILKNMDGFNVFQHSCPACITAYLNLLDIYERYIPGYVKDIVVINAPQAYLVLLEILRPVLSRQTRDALRIFSSNKSKWKPYIDARVDPNQLPSYFGGNKVEKQI